MFTETDLQQIQSRGSSLEEVQQQIQHFETGFPSLKIEKAATVGDGLIRLSEEEVNRYAADFTQTLGGLKVLKFVPASGAASRMFKDLFSFMDSYDGSAEAFERFQNDKKPAALHQFFSRITSFAFFDDLAAAMGGEDALNQAIASGKLGAVLQALLGEDGLDYGSLPKGLLKFHSYEDGARTPAEEHLVEGANYAKDDAGRVRLHFTVSPEHRTRFEQLVATVSKVYEQRFQAKFNVSYSEQKPSTDTIAVDLGNKPFREADGSLLFRPGGHGALLSNLNDLDADIIFIKNIDNVVPDRLKGETYRYKKALAGLLLSYRERIFGFLEKLDHNPDGATLRNAAHFLEETLCVQPPAGYSAMTEVQQRAYVMGKLNRPMRVCGMVKNEGEPGGGPFWAENPDGSVSLQIAESAQIDLSDAGQKAIMEGSTHFNPVDLVCATRDRKGVRFDLMQHRDPQTGFISQKSKDGRDLKAQELPGLWNGAMSDWNTLFVEVPVITFNPVKTVNDLLRDQHQG